MLLLLTFITIWALAPGPVFVMTIHEARKHGPLAGVAVSGGASLTAVLMVIAGLIVHSAGFSAILDSDGMLFIERLGALGIVMVGVHAGYKCFWDKSMQLSANNVENNTRIGFVQGMMLMATYIPQALLFYNVIVPQSVAFDTVLSTIVTVGALKVALIFVWHTGVAFVTDRAQRVVSSHRFGKALELASACLITGMGVNILI